MAITKNVVAGFALGPSKAFEKFLEPSVAPRELYKFAPGQALFPESAGYVISAIVAIVGLALAHSLYSSRRKTGELQPEAVKTRNPVYNFLYNKWYWDALYNRIFIGIGGWFSDRILWRTIDAGLIDGMVNAAAYFVGGLSQAGRRLQTGYVRNYALGMLFGVVVLVVGLIYTYSRLTP